MAQQSEKKEGNAASYTSSKIPAISLFAKRRLPSWVIGTRRWIGQISGNLITHFSLGANATLFLGLLALSDGVRIMSNGLGVLTGTPGGTGTINYASGALTITGGALNAVLLGTFEYYPDLPVMDIEDICACPANLPWQSSLRHTYSYNILTTSPFTAYDVSFYNPPSDTINGIAYTAKTLPTPLTWNGQNYQQFWSVNYENAIG